MSEIYVFDAKCEDFTSFGLVGALTPASCVFEEEANGMSEVTLDHPMDALGRYKALVVNNLLTVNVPVRTTPEISDDAAGFVTNVWICKVQSASTAYRTLYKTRTGSGKIKVLPVGTQVTVVKKYAEGRWKVKSSKYGTGWVHQDALTEETSVTLENSSQGIESVEPAWTIKPQVFRIYEVRKDIASVTVSARHITYDLMFDVTTFKASENTTCKEALAGIFDNLVAMPPNFLGESTNFSAYTNLSNEYAGIDWTRINPINAMLDPETGLTALFKASLVRDNWEMYFLNDPGMNRGVTVEYGRNMTGIDYVEHTDEVATRIIPVGETKDGKPLLLNGPAYDSITGEPITYVTSPRLVVVDGVELSIESIYPYPYMMVLECENCKVGSNGLADETQARNRMREQAMSMFDSDIDLPKIEMSVDFIDLGDTEEYKQFRNLERLFLWDYVHVRHKAHGIDVLAKVVYIKWDCLLDRMERMDVGSSIKTLADSQSAPAGPAVIVGGGISASGGTMTGPLILSGSPSEALEAVTKQYVDDAIRNVGGGSGGGANYSTEEVSTGVQWIDGKTIYQKVVHMGDLPTNGTLTKALESGPISALIDVRGFGIRGTGIRPIPYVNTTAGAQCYVRIDDYATEPKVVLIAGSSGSVDDAYIILQYTKSTDAATTEVT